MTMGMMRCMVHLLLVPKHRGQISMALDTMSEIVDAMLCVGHRVRLSMFLCEISLVVVW